LSARLEGWPRGPWFETPRKSAAPHHEVPVWINPFHSSFTRVGRRPVLNSQRRGEASAVLSLPKPERHSLSPQRKWIWPGRQSWWALASSHGARIRAWHCSAVVRIAGTDKSVKHVALQRSDMAESVEIVLSHTGVGVGAERRSNQNFLRISWAVQVP
jgi:hypothetical protein